MHRQRTFLSIATTLASISYLFKWLGNGWFYFSGFHFGYMGKVTLVFYVGMLVVTMIDIADRPLSKERLVVLLITIISCFVAMLYKVYPAFKRLNFQDQNWSVVGIGLVLFVCSNLFMVGYCLFSYKNDYVLPEKDDSVLDG